MKIGFIGLGRMGLNMVYNLKDHKHEVVVYNRSPEPIEKAAQYGAISTSSLKELVAALSFSKSHYSQKNIKKSSPRIIWLMITAGKPVDDMLSQLVPLLEKGDIIIEGGNSYFKDSQRRCVELQKKGIHFLDCGTSGGIDGARHGACMMVGGDKNIFSTVEILFKDMCVKDGYGHMGESGSGHFVKMVHNGIEYGMMGAIAEGVQAIKDAPISISMHNAVTVYAHGSIIQSRLMSWLLEAYNEGLLDKISGQVPKGETENEMEKLEILAKMPLLTAARMMRIKTRTEPSYAGKILAAVRNKFGGHAVVSKENFTKFSKTN